MDRVGATGVMGARKEDKGVTGTGGQGKFHWEKDLSRPLKNMRELATQKTHWGKEPQREGAVSVKAPS